MSRPLVTAVRPACGNPNMPQWTISLAVYLYLPALGVNVLNCRVGRAYSVQDPASDRPRRWPAGSTHTSADSDLQTGDAALS
jgi:hypothetical protein